MKIQPPMRPSLRPQLLLSLLLLGASLLAGLALAQSPDARAAMRQAGILAAPAQQEISTLAIPNIAAAFNYQGMLRDENGAPVSGIYTIKARLYQSQDTFEVWDWEDTFDNVVVRNGRFNMVLGSQVPLGDVFATSPRFIGLTVNGLQPGSPTELQPREQVRSVPWTIYAGNARYADGAEHADFAFSASTATVANSSTTATNYTNLNPTVWVANGFGQEGFVTTNVTGFQSNPSGTMCVLTGVQLDVDRRAPKCTFNYDTGQLTAGPRNRCEVTCFTYDSTN